MGEFSHRAQNGSGIYLCLGGGKWDKVNYPVHFRAKHQYRLIWPILGLWAVNKNLAGSAHLRPVAETVCCC
jgi:hypothetical protein